MIRKIDHIAIIVRDIDEALKKYSDMFGFRVVESLMGPDEEFKSVLISSGDVTVELLQPLSANGSFARFLEERGGGLHHVSFNTDDIEQELKSLKAKGTRLVNEEPENLPSARIAFIHPKSTEGVLIELVQRD